MNRPTFLRRAQALSSVAALSALGLLAGCGGGGGDEGRPPPTVQLATTTSVKYSETMLVTLSGTNLDQPLTLTSNACRDFARSTTAPNVSTPTTAYFTCTVSGRTGDQSVVVTGGGIQLVTVPFTVPVPEVTMTITNGTGPVVGTMVVRLAPDVAPVTVDNFLAYVKAGHYNGLAFHRHGRFDNGGTFVLQAGAYAAPISSTAAFPAARPQRPPIVLERGLSHRRYVLGMARTSNPNSATSEFFINTVDNLFLDGNGTTANPGYAAFGTVVTGTTLVDQMVTATCNLSPINFDPPPPLAPSRDCVPEPNLVIGAALQTR